MIVHTCRELGMECHEAHCPAGERQLFTEKSIKAGHYLLFFFAAVSVRHTGPAFWHSQSGRQNMKLKEGRSITGRQL